jgi:hypothetical protein
MVRSCCRPGSDLHPLLRREDRASLPDRAEREAKVDDEPEDRHDERDREERCLAANDRREDLLIADLAEPEPVGVEAEQRRPAEEDQREGDEDGEAKGVAHVRTGIDCSRW